MAVDLLQKTAETARAAAGVRARGRPFRKGQSGNPAGRPKGSRNIATRIAAALLDGEAEALTRKAIELALAGDPVALRLCLDRILGVRRGRPVDLRGTLSGDPRGAAGEAPAVPPPASVADLAAAMSAVAAAATSGVITPDEALALAQMVESFARTLAAVHDERVRNWRYARYQDSLAKPSGG